MRSPFALALLLAGCDQGTVVEHDVSAGARLEVAASEAQLIPDAARATLVGAWARDTDRVCIVPGDGNVFRMGVRVDYGEGQSCAASGTATRSGRRVRVTFGACRFDARFDGDRLVFPPEVPAACDRWCRGRASLAALTVEQLSTSLSEASTLRGPRGGALCSG